MCVVIAIADTAIALVPQTAHARRTDCLVRNVRTGVTETGHGSNLQRSITSAEPRDTLLIKGRCVGTFTATKVLHLVGGATKRYAQPVLDANEEGSVLTTTALVVVDGLTIRDGRARCGGGIYSRSDRLILDGDTLVVGNRAKRGGGVCASILSVLGNAVIRGNHSSVNGGGISAFDNGFIRLRADSSIRMNRTEGNGGGVGGDIASIQLRERATIRGNYAAANGGGIAGYGSHIYVEAFSRIVHNVAGGKGGGVIGMRSISVCPTARIAPNQPNDLPTDVKIAC
jgi:hypothetical protein